MMLGEEDHQGEGSWMGSMAMEACRLNQYKQDAVTMAIRPSSIPYDTLYYRLHTTSSFYGKWPFCFGGGCSLFSIEWRTSQTNKGDQAVVSLL